jgi:hypothetical protein
VTELILAAKVVSLYLAIAYGTAFAVKWSRGHPIATMQNVAMSGGITAFVALQWLV